MGQLSALPNIGPALEKQLSQIGVATVEALRNRGAKQCWLDILAGDPSACIHRLYALEGAIRGIPKIALPDEIKAELKNFYREFCPLKK